MNRDLSLSDTFGGLRIANPDLDDASTPQIPAGPAAADAAAVSENKTAQAAIGHPPAFAPSAASSVTDRAGPDLGPASPQSHHSSKPASGPTPPYQYSHHSRPSTASSRPVSLGPSQQNFGQQLPPSSLQHSHPAGSASHSPGYVQPQSREGPSHESADVAFIPPSSEEWKDRGAAVTTVQETDENGNVVTKAVKRGVRDFVFGRTLGEGSYSTVVAATDKIPPNREYAIKVLDKRHIIKEKKVKYVNIEKNTLNLLTSHPGIVRLYYTFQDESSLYFTLDLASNGELLGVLKEYGTFNLECTQFYAAEILDAIEYMHKRGVIHRDLKPENVLLDRFMHVKITDFGTAKILGPPPAPSTGPTDPNAEVPHDRASSFVGTAEYVSPELLTNKSACRASDLWAFGCIVFQLLAGRPPFKGPNEYQTFQKIVNMDYHFPDGFPPVARDLVERLLVADPVERLTIDQIKAHDFFKGVEWGIGLWSRRAPPLQPMFPSGSEEANQGLGANRPGQLAPALAATLALGPVPHSQRPGAQASRGSGRVLPALPPPTQLDIEWSAVLTKANERILKLGNLTVTTSPALAGGHSKQSETSNRLSRFFAATGTKKRNRLVILTTYGRIILAAIGGNEKKSKMEILLCEEGVSWKTSRDPKGFTSWTVDTREKHIVFEDPKSSTLEPEGTLHSTNEWIDALGRSRELARAHEQMLLDDAEIEALSVSNVDTPSIGGGIDDDVSPNMGPRIGMGSSDPNMASGTAAPPHQSGPDRTGRANELVPPGAVGAVLSGASTPSTSSTKASGIFRHLYGSSHNVGHQAASPAISDEHISTGSAASRKRFSKRQSRAGSAAVF